MKKFLAATVCVGLILFAQASQSSPVHYDEAVSGDLVSGPVTQFSLGLGINTISGTMTLSSTTDALGEPQMFIDQDPFAFSIVPGGHIRRMSVTGQFLANGQSSNTTAFSWTWTLVDALSQALIGQDCLSLVGSTCRSMAAGGSDLFSGLLGQSTYMVYSAGAFQSLDFMQPAGGSFQYTTSIEVTDVPEPSTFASTSAALLGLGLVTARRRRRSEAMSWSTKRA
ncbi:PEP-CTERM sorting domain-containing protein [Roseateles sp.]|uniref:PEP-CTERM sorting domain-containing protein n=1 Tax=Roseateles sp. TaxID=1971397 RepID=UPI003D10A2EE